MCQHFTLNLVIAFRCLPTNQFFFRRGSGWLYIFVPCLLIVIFINEFLSLTSKSMPDLISFMFIELVLFINRAVAHYHSWGGGGVNGFMFRTFSIDFFLPVCNHVLPKILCVLSQLV